MMNSPVFPYVRIHGKVADIKGEKIIMGKPMRSSLLPHQLDQDLLLIIKLAKNPVRMKNNGMRQICMKWKMAVTTCDELSSAGQSASIFGIYGSAACRTMPRSIAIPLNPSSPWYLVELHCAI